MIFPRWLPTGLLLIPLMANCGKKNDAASASAAKHFVTPWSCEEHWMVAETVKDLQGMVKLCGASIGGESTVPAKAGHEYQVGQVTLKLSPSCWDLASYERLLESWRPAGQAADDPAPDLLHDLLTPTAKSLQMANKTISERIKATPSVPAVHEEAAFLLGVFGIRENARQFGDLRPLLGRMTAHLVLARHLRGGQEPSNIGKWAQVLYDYHAGRPLKAREEMQTLAADGDAGRWKRVVELLITGDWRRTQELAEPSLVEAIAHARALKGHRGNPVMLEFVGQREDLQQLPEWSRLLADQGRSVADGHLVMKSGLALELAEIREIFAIGGNPAPEKLARFLAAESSNTLVDEAGLPRVIADGDWAAYFRRHFFACCADTSTFAISIWASKPDAAAWEESVLPYCRKLPGHELVESFLATDASVYQADLRVAADYILHHPEKAPLCVWRDHAFPTLGVSAETPMPDQIPWFREVSPPGTAFDPMRRIRFNGMRENWPKRIGVLHEIDPWDIELCWELAENTGNNLASVKRVWGDIREYSIKPLRQTLYSPTLTPDERIETLKILAPLDLDEYLRLGLSLVIAGRPEEAIKAYETAFKDAPDRIDVSASTQWMIYYYKSKGLDQKAREVADHNEEVYSSRGLVSALTLAVVEKDPRRAMKLATAIEERYGDSRYVPVAQWDGGNNKKLFDNVFPDGWKEVTLADFVPGEPAKGARIVENSLTASLVGLRAGDVILAIDGKRVESYRQYFMLMSTSLEPHTRIIYRRGKKFAEVDCQLPDRRLDTNMADAVK
jgi:tetratricopeptide (TPR) repeat protein